VTIVNNLEWTRPLNFLEFMRTVGKNVKLQHMLAREAVQTRLNSEAGISYAEFSYQLLQAYDFYVLHTKYGCNVQLGGSDQWGNITAGVDLIRRLSIPETETDRREDSAFGITMPLITTASGEKFGKSAGNAVWLDRELTSVFDFYQVHPIPL
jgi:tyrosyl-tRNA synthetase